MYTPLVREIRAGDDRRAMTSLSMQTYVPTSRRIAMVKKLALVVIIILMGNTGFAGKPQKWEELPKAVQDTVLANGGTSGMSVDLEPKKIDGKAVYEAGIKGKDGNIRDLVITEDGKLVETKTDDAADAFVLNGLQSLRHIRLLRSASK